ncbi:MAG: DinG family ATP-dependent helicase YoaA [uncultured Thermomicrobiales bacterium]|uniref:3'-5' exonuclease DinG n=1 Tax=uncultured Thermomicrobiales bacterium TaxID=1645740 RepID=A0A6J4UXQ7_9BACT|nr:MAG: DinG family ATP-dependent helicase YoaA [uncultured Thermomicrobiales bacterium]
MERFSTLVRPRQSLSLDISRLTGITAAEVAAAPSFSDVSADIKRFIGTRTLVGHSVQMDIAMLRSAGLALENPWVDTFHLATVMLHDLPHFSLSAVAVALGVEGTSSHRAVGDVEVTAAVFHALIERVERLDALTLGQLVTYARQASWPSAEVFAAVAGTGDAGPLFEVAGESDRQGPHELRFLTARERPEPLRPTNSRATIKRAEVDAALSPAGAVSQSVPGYEDRPQQRQMARAVTAAFNEGKNLVVEAGTGTGKSLAYLLPAVMHAVEHGEAVVVSTNTLALQDQLYQKDIPLLRRALAGDERFGAFEAALLKGRTNYLCLRRWFANRSQPALDPAEAGMRGKVTLWLNQTESGDRSELRLDGEEENHWRPISAEEHACVASRCVYQQRNQCFLFRARREAESAHIVIANHALVLSDAMAGSHVLPEYRRLIVDEAHHLEDQATKQFGFSLEERAFHDAIDAALRLEGTVMVGALPMAADYLRLNARSETGKRRAEAAEARLRARHATIMEARRHITRLFNLLDAVIDAGDARGGRSVRLTGDIRSTLAWVDIEDAGAAIDAAWRAIETDLRWLLDAVEAAEPDPGTTIDDPAMQQFEDVSSALLSTVRDGADLMVKLQVTIGSPSQEMVYWVERSPIAQRTSLHAAPLQVDGVLREQVFSRLDTAVLTSATITTDGSFSYMVERLGIEDPKEVAVASPFDYALSTLLYLADDMPEPNHPRYASQLQRTLIDTLIATEGRALVLFTSHAALQQTYHAIKRPLEDAGVIVLGQRLDGNPRQLIERLRHSSRVALLGTASFWEGVDVVGAALSLLVIAKLPFAVPTDPIVAARGELVEDQGGHPFFDYAVPQAVLKFKQGFGRLIRSSGDRGVCAVLDGRVISKRYGRSFVESLPDCTLVVGSSRDLPADAAAWIDPVPSGRR